MACYWIRAYFFIILRKGSDSLTTSECTEFAGKRLFADQGSTADPLRAILCFANRRDTISSMLERLLKATRRDALCQFVKRGVLPWSSRSESPKPHALLQYLELPKYPVPDKTFDMFEMIDVRPQGSPWANIGIKYADSDGHSNASKLNHKNIC